MSLRIAINAQLLPGQGTGGIESALIGLVAALGRLTDGPEEYTIIGPPQEPDWLKPFLGPNQRIVAGPKPPEPPPQPPEQKPGLAERCKRALGPARPPARRAWRRLFPLPALPSPTVQPPQTERWPEMPLSDGFYEALGCDLIHFPFQTFALCALPSIFSPHDLQQRHFPQFFTVRDLAWREMMYRGGCELAQAVAVGSQWVKDDVVREYHISPDRIQVIPFAPPTRALPAPTAAEISAAAARYRLDAPFAFYPSMAWEHKNHVRLFEALALLRDRDGMTVRLACTANVGLPFWPRIQAAVAENHLETQVKFLGYIPKEDLRALYRLAQFVVVPSLFEEQSCPVYEAWQDRVAAACSAVTSLPDQVGDAALLFDPYSVEAIAQAVRRMAADEALRAQLVARGAERLKRFRWDYTAKAYRALYRRVAHRPLTQEDQVFLKWDWMRNPVPPES